MYFTFPPLNFINTSIIIILNENKVQFGLNETVSISVFVVRLKSFEKLVISNNNNMMKWASENYIRFYVTKDQARDKASATK